MNNDIKFIHTLQAQNHFLTLHSLEKEFSAPVEVMINGQSTTLYIKGKIDRVDSFRGQVRITDYKSSVKDTDKFVFDSFEKLFQDKNYNKQFQLFIYAWLLYKSNASAPETLMPCIVPFKVFLEEPKYILDGTKKPFVFTAQFFQDFENELKQFIATVFDQNIPFLQTEDEKTHEFCPYNTICNFKV